MSEHEEFKSLPYINDSLVKKNITHDNTRNHEELQYLNLIQNILDNGCLEQGRNGNTKSIFGGSMRFSLKDGKIPILTTKKVAWKTCLKELLWFIRGETDNKLLKNQNVHISFSLNNGFKYILKITNSFVKGVKYLLCLYYDGNYYKK
jgi:hypothetical protein